MTAPPWWVYVLLCADKSLYTGATNNLEKRLDTHKRGKGSKYVRSRLPFTLAATWPCKDRSAALKLEAKFKKLTRKQKDKQVQAYAAGLGGS